jgi:hypothetical protein
VLVALWPTCTLFADLPPTQAETLLAFKASGGAANDAPLASWRNGTDPCGGEWPWVPAWRGVACTGGAVTELELSGYYHPELKTLAGDVGALAPLLKLTRLWLSDTKVGGDVKGLAPLTRLTSLELYNTEVGGDVKGLAPLTQLTILGLEKTEVEGCGAFCGEGGPFRAACEPTHGADGCRNGFDQGCFC